MIKKSLTLILFCSIFIFVSLTGCGQKNDTQAKSDTPPPIEAVQPQKTNSDTSSENITTPTTKIDSQPVFQCDYFGQEKPGTTAKLFIPGSLNDPNHNYHSSLTFSLDGKEVYWSAYYKPAGSKSSMQHIFFCKNENGSWSIPAVAAFSGTFHDGGPFIEPGGKKLFFYSNRPAEKGGTPSNEYINDIWFVERNGDDWGEPQRLAFNTDYHEGTPSVTRDGTIYFVADYPDKQGPFDVYRARLVNGVYSKPENIGLPINTKHLKFSPYIAPDESYLIVAYSARPGGNGLYISFKKKDGNWTTPGNMGKVIDAERFPGMSPDEQFLFFTRSIKGKRSLYWVESSIINQFRPQE